MTLMTFLAGLVPLAQRLLTVSWQAAVLAALVFVIVHLAGRRLSARARHGLWLLVAVRLLLPATPASPVSLFNLLPQTVDEPAVDMSANGPREGVVPASSDEAEVSSPSARLSKAAEVLPAGRVAESAAPPGHASLHRQGVGAISDPPAGMAEPSPPALAAQESSPAPRSSATGLASVSSRVRPALPGNGDTSSPSADRWTWPQLAAGVYALVAAVLLVRLGAAAIVLSRRVGRLPAVIAPDLTALLDRCRREMGIRQPVRLRRTETGGAALAGLIHPTILLPAGAMDDLPREQLRFVLLHELGHLRRWDVATNLLSRILAALHWPNLAVHAAFARMRADRELACDELVLARIGGTQGRSYGHTIVHLAQQRATSAPLPGVLGVAEKSNHLRRRIEMISTYRPTGRVHALLALVLTSLLAVTALTSAQRAGSQESDPQTDGAPVAGDAESRRPTARGSYLAPTTAEAYGPDSSPGELAAPPTESAPIEAKLDEPIKVVDFRDVVLADVIEFLRHVTGANILVRWNALEPAGIEPTTKVSLRLEDLPARRVLRAVLDSVSAEVQLDWMIDKGVVYISRAADLSRQPRRVVFDVSDLLEAGRPDRATPEAPYRGRAMPPGSTGAGPLFGPGGHRMPSRSSRSASTTRDELMEAVRGVCMQKTWRGNGGYGVVSVISGKLLVTQGPRQLRRIHRLIARLRANVLDQRDAATLGRIEQERRRDARLADKLAEKIEQVDFQSVPLSAVIDFVREVRGVNIQTQWGVLEKAGIDRQAPVTLRLKGASAATVLQAALGRVGGSPPIGYAVDDGMVLITTTDRLRLHQKVEVWDVRPIVDDPSQDTPPDALLQAILGHIAPDSWAGRGGYGFADEVLGQLVVRQTPDCLKEIGSLVTVLLAGANKTEGEKLSAMTKMLQHQIEVYAADHGRFPSARSIDQQLTQYTSREGFVSPGRGEQYLFGPYLNTIPPVPVGYRAGQRGIAAEDGPSVGWLYDENTGRIRPNLGRDGGS